MLKHAFASRNDAERIDAMLEGKEVHLTTPESHEDLKTHVHEVFMADDDYSMIERGIGSMLKRLL